MIDFPEYPKNVCRPETDKSETNNCRWHEEIQKHIGDVKSLVNNHECKELTSQQMDENNKGRRPKKTRIFHDIVQNSFDIYPPYLIMT